MIKASVVIPTKNSSGTIGECLSSVFNQEFEGGFEVIVIDSGSVDETVDIIRKFRVRLVEIKPEEFHHSTTRNYGAQLAQGEYVVYLSGDAAPKGKRWLSKIVANFKDLKVAGVSGRQVPKGDAAPMEIHWLNYFYTSRKKTAYLGKNAKQVREDQFYFFSNVNSAMRRSVLLEHKFPQHIIMAEDKAWCREVLLSGYKVVYEPKAVVAHSHHYSLKTAFQNSFSAGMAYAQFCEFSAEFNPFFFIKQGVHYFTSEMCFLARNGYYKYLLYAPVYDFMKYMGRFLGKYYNHLPDFVNARLCQDDGIYQRLYINSREKEVSD